MIEGTFPAGRVDPIGVAPAEVVALAARCELLEAVAEASAEYLAAFADVEGRSVCSVEQADRVDAARASMRAALVAAGATGKAGT